MSVHFLNSDGEKTTYNKGDLLIFKKRDMVWFSIKRDGIFLNWTNSSTAVIVPLEMDKGQVRCYVNGLLLESGQTASFVDDYESDDSVGNEIVFRID